MSEIDELAREMLSSTEGLTRRMALSARGLVKQPMADGKMANGQRL